VARASRQALEPFERAASDGEASYAVQHELQNVMQNLVGIVRTEQQMLRALTDITQLRERAGRVVVSGNREYNPGWHTALDLTHLLLVSEAVARAAIERKESRGAQFREDYPAKSEEAAKDNLVIARGGDGAMQVRREPIPPLRDDLRQIIEELR
jgi:succinate dehydrogenase / fumarate reductase flavoprotein subunit